MYTFFIVNNYLLLYNYNGDNMKNRIIGAVILLGILVPLIMLGGLPFGVGATIIATFSYRELFNLFKKDRKIPLLIEIFSYISVIVVTLSFESIIEAIALSVILMLVPLLFYKEDEYNYNDGVNLLGYILFIGIAYHVLISARIASLEEFLYIPIISVLTDTFAYLAGTLFGKNKLIERISPNKTIEGSLVGLIVATSIGSVYYLFFVDPGASIVFVLISTFLLSIMAMIGDLVFSSVKRQCKIKDYSNIIPGHGGFLDRFDSIIFVALFYAIIRLILL